MVKTQCLHVNRYINLLVQTTKSSTVHDGNEPDQYLTTLIHLFIHSLTQTSDTGVVSEMYSTDTISSNVVTFILLMHSYIQIPSSPTHPSAPAPKIKFYDQICTIPVTRLDGLGSWGVRACHVPPGGTCPHAPTLVQNRPISRRL